MYRHTQTGWVTLIACGVPGAILLIAGFAALGRPGASAAGLLTLGVVLVVTARLFSSLTVVVDEESVEFWVGPGWIRRRILLSQIALADPVRNSPAYGWGIHWIPDVGWLWNVSGLGAVELILNDGRRIRVGSDEPEILGRFINDRL